MTTFLLFHLDSFIYLFFNRMLLAFQPQWSQLNWFSIVWNISQNNSVSLTIICLNDVSFLKICVGEKGSGHVSTDLENGNYFWSSQWRLKSFHRVNYCSFFPQWFKLITFEREKMFMNLWNFKKIYCKYCEIQVRRKL